MIASSITDTLVSDFSISRVMPGAYPTQRGSFDIATDNFILSICVWEGGVVEIEVHTVGGLMRESETLRDSPIDVVIGKIQKQLKKLI